MRDLVKNKFSETAAAAALPAFANILRMFPTPAPVAGVAPEVEQMRAINRINRKTLLEARPGSKPDPMTPFALALAACAFKLFEQANGALPKKNDGINLVAGVFKACDIALAPEGFAADAGKAARTIRRVQSL